MYRIFRKYNIYTEQEVKHVLQNELILLRNKNNFHIDPWEYW